MALAVCVFATESQNVQDQEAAEQFFHINGYYPSWYTAAYYPFAGVRSYYNYAGVRTYPYNTRYIGARTYPFGSSGYNYVY